MLIDESSQNTKHIHMCPTDSFCRHSEMVIIVWGFVDDSFSCTTMAFRPRAATRQGEGCWRQSAWILCRSACEASFVICLCFWNRGARGRGPPGAVLRTIRHSVRPGSPQSEGCMCYHCESFSLLRSALAFPAQRKAILWELELQLA